MAKPFFRMGASAVVVPTRLLVCAGLVALFGCDKPKSEPTKVTEDSSPIQRPRREYNDDGPFRNPNRVAPEGREGEQLADEELEKTIEEAQVDLDNNRRSAAAIKLRKCANKTPASGRCDAMLGLLMNKQGTRKADMLYYLNLASEVDDPKGSKELYYELAEANRKAGQYEAAAASVRTALKREESADGHEKLSHMLQSIPGKEQEAIEALARAYELDPDKHELLFERATLLGQSTKTVGEAAELFREYQGKIESSDPEKAKTLDSRIAELEGMAKAAAANPKKDDKGGDDSAKGKKKAG